MTDRQPPRRVWVLTQHGDIVGSFRTRRAARSALEWRVADYGDYWRLFAYDLHTPKPKPRARRKAER